MVGWLDQWCCCDKRRTVWHSGESFRNGLEIDASQLAKGAIG
ncbi:MAG: hypothetical protein AAGA01_01535 [Cyanobacteria bacterium P01_E01_bin.43]